MPRPTNSLTAMRMATAVINIDAGRPQPNDNQVKERL